MIKTITLPGMQPRRRVIETTGTHVIIGVEPPLFLGLPEQRLALTTEQYARYCIWLARGGMVQDLFPELSVSQREIILSGLGNDDFHRLAGGDE